MNAMFAVVFLAACVAAQTFDFDRTTGTTTADLKQLLLKSRLGLGLNTNTKFDQLSIADLFGKHYNTIGQGIDLDRVNVNTPFVYPRSYYNNYNRVQGVDVDTPYTPYTHTVYTLEEIVRHPLFRQYVVLPYFRQHLSHPLFQYYLTTPLFQQYWTIPQFQTFFQNPYLFYKYVYPVVYNTESTIFDQVKTDSLYPYGRYSPVDVDVDRSSSIVDPIVDVNRYLSQSPVVGGHQSMLDSLVNKYQYPSVYPSVYGRDQRYAGLGLGLDRVGQRQQYSSIFRHHLPYTYVMDKIFHSYFINKPQITEVITDVKVQPDNVADEQTIGKIVDPITGDAKYSTGDLKVVDEKIVPVEHNFDNMIGQLLGGSRIGKHFNVKDTLLKRMYLNKVLYGDRKFDEVYPEYSAEPQTFTGYGNLKDLPILDKIEKLNKIHRLENLVNGDNYKYKYDDLLTTGTRVPLTKDFTLSNKFETPIEFKTLDKPTSTKTVIV